VLTRKNTTSKEEICWCWLCCRWGAGGLAAPASAPGAPEPVCGRRLHDQPASRQSRGRGNEARVFEMMQGRWLQELVQGLAAWAPTNGRLVSCVQQTVVVIKWAARHAKNAEGDRGRGTVRGTCT
jgi:hypothetical protein